jgi:acetyl esterase/lipase
MGVERNVVFGMYSGLALLMDVHRSEKPNGYGVLFVAGSGWQAPLGWDAAGLKDKEAQVRAWVMPLVRSGYTVFAVNHRAAPRFRYPAALDDVQRALRFLRRHAGAYGIDASRLGAVAGSSGAHLACLAAMLGAPGTAADGDPVNRESAALQCAVLRAPPTDLQRMAEDADGEGRGYVLSFVDEAFYAAASPITHVSQAAPPVLLIHGDADRIVPFGQSLALEAALRTAGARARLIRIPGGAHGSDFGADGAPRPGWPDYLGETVSWLDRHLRDQP